MLLVLSMMSLSIGCSIGPLGGDKGTVYEMTHGSAPRILNAESIDFFRETVAPVLARTCSSKDETGAFICHGRPSNRDGDKAGDFKVAKSHSEVDRAQARCATRCHTTANFRFPLGADGGLTDPDQVMLAYRIAQARAQFDSASGFANLVRMPLSAQAGGFGLRHAGGEIFESAMDPDYLALSRWVALENQGKDDGGTPLTPAEIAFRDEVLPAFARNTCFAASCHVFNHSSFLLDPGMPSADPGAKLQDRFTREQISFNRMTSRGLIQTLVHLEGQVDQSRILKKCIPLEKGGVLHRGGKPPLSQEVCTS